MPVRGLRYRETPPGAAAAPVVSAYWGFDVHELPSPDFVHRVWPDGCVSLLFVCAGPHAVATVIRGVTREPHDVPVVPGTRYHGIRFRPECGARLVGVPAATLRDRNEDAGALLGDEVRTLAAAVAEADDDARVHARFDAWVASRVQRLPMAPGDVTQERVARAVSLLMQHDGQLRVKDVAAQCGVHERTLQRQFLQAVGLTLKQFAQVRRTRGMLRRSVEEQLPGRIGWAGVAAEAGYADQSHLAREVTRHTRLSPSRLQDRLSHIDHDGLVD